MHGTRMTAFEDSTGDDDDSLVFRPLTIWIVVICYSLAGIGLFAYHYAKGTALTAPIDPLFRSLMGGAGAFVGVWLAAVIRDAWDMGITFRGPVPRGVYALVQLLALVVASGFAGGFVADVLVEWRAFRGLEPAAKQEAFEVLEHHFGTRAPDWLDLEAASGSRFSVNCPLQACSGVPKGSKLELSVETGRGGVERIVLPRHMRDHLLRG
jgi:hypothetical protein